MSEFNLPQSVTAFAPASVGNVAVGFDLLGHAIDGPGDQVTVRRAAPGSGMSIRAIRGADAALPDKPTENTAGRALLALCVALDLPDDFEIEIDKGIPLASGLGGSAASAVAAVVAANRLLSLDWPPERLYPYALAGEAVASGAAHGDNVGPQLLGGLVLATPDRLLPIPVPGNLYAVAVHPDHRVNTRDARRCLETPFDLGVIVRQSSNLALVLEGCHRGDFELIRAGLNDVMVEPRRAALIPGFLAVKHAALQADALGASISGAGPTVFAWFDSLAGATAAGADMVEAFASAGKTARAHVTPVAARGARVISSK